VYSGTAPYLLSSSGLPSDSPSALYFQSSYSSEEHGQSGSEQVSVREEPGKKLMVCPKYCKESGMLTFQIANFKAGNRPLSTDGLRKVRTDR